MRVRLDNVVKRFKTTAALTGVSLTVEDGEFFTLLGPSGCGKTTTLRVVAGFYDPDGGTVFFDDVSQNGVPPAQRGIGIVFQNYALWPHMTVEGNVAYGLKLQRVPGNDMRRRVSAALEQVGLSGLEGRLPGQLSGGQQQRVAVARALVLNPKVLLLDEPLSNLDAKVRSRLRSEIRRLQQALGITTIYVTHDQEEAMVLSDRIAVMDAGAVLQIGSPVDLYERPASLFVADFIGISNLIPGEVAEAGVGRVTVRTPAGTVRGVPVGRVEPGGSAMVAVRPEKMQVVDDEALETTLPGAVVLTQYLGSSIRYEVEMAGGIVVRIDVGDPHRHARLAAGDRVRIGFAAAAAQVFARGR